MSLGKANRTKLEIDGHIKLRYGSLNPVLRVLVSERQSKETVTYRYLVC